MVVPLEISEAVENDGIGSDRRNLAVSQMKIDNLKETHLKMDGPTRPRAETFSWKRGVGRSRCKTENEVGKERRAQSSFDNRTKRSNILEESEQKEF